jgi:thiol-disulfide isomerase/thioredoxin
MVNLNPCLKFNQEVSVYELMKWNSLFFILFISIPGFSQDVRIVKFNEIENVIRSGSDTLYILNFWATWCKPCVEELPYFEAATSEFAGEKMKIILVSLDFPNQLQSRLIPFLNRRDMKTDVWLLDESNANTFIDKISIAWSGAIPATLFMNNTRNIDYFFEGSFTKKKLFNKINELL